MEEYKKNSKMNNLLNRPRGIQREYLTLILSLRDEMIN